MGHHLPLSLCRINPIWPSRERILNSKPKLGNLNGAQKNSSYFMVRPKFLLCLGQVHFSIQMVYIFTGLSFIHVVCIYSQKFGGVRPTYHTLHSQALMFAEVRSDSEFLLLQVPCNTSVHQNFIISATFKFWGR